MKKKEECEGLFEVRRMLESSLRNANFYMLSCGAMLNHFKKVEIEKTGKIEDEAKIFFNDCSKLEKHFMKQIKYCKDKLKTIDKILEDPVQRARWEELLNMTGFEG